MNCNPAGIRPETGRKPAGNRPETGRNPAGNRPETGRNPAGIRPASGGNPAGIRPGGRSGGRQICFVEKSTFLDFWNMYFMDFVISE